MTEAGASKPKGARLDAVRPQSDERLSKRARKGDRRAFEAIYRRYHQDLYRFCLTLVGNPQDAEEALQNTMVKALRALPGDQRRIQLRPWLYQIARNESIETLRKRREGVPIAADLIPSRHETAETVEAREHLRRLIADLSALPDRQRAALVMREMGGLSFAEIGDALETSQATSRQTVYEARLGLRQMEAGREMKCKEVTLALSEADGRVTRRRDIQAHLRSCHDCRAFRNGITKRRGELGALAPLPAVASAGLLQSVLGAGHSVAAGGLAGATGAAAGKVAATSVIAKTAATVAVVAVVGVTAADRGGLIDAPIDGNGGATPGASSAPDPSHSGDGSQAAGDDEESDSLEQGDRGEGERRAPVPVAKVGATAEAGAASEVAPSGPPETEPASKPAMAQGEASGKGASKGAKGQGHQDGLPAAAEHGQRTAAEHKSPRANPTPGTPPARGGAKETVNRQPPPFAKEPKAPASPPPSPSETASPERGDSASKVPDRPVDP